jgi:hypothetical protein
MSKQLEQVKEGAIENVTEGTWALPETEEDAMKIAAMMNNPVALGDGGDDAINALGGLLGDDELFDDLGDAGDKDPEGDARPIIIGWMMEHTDWENPKYGEAIKMALDKIKADGNDTMVIPRTFGNTSATQGERMGSNAAQIKQNEDAVTENAERMIKVTNIQWDADNPADVADLPRDVVLKINVPYDADEDDIDDIVADELTDRYGFTHGGFETQFAESIEEGMCSLKCKHCGDMLGQPTTDCECDSMDPKGDHWEMVDIDGDGDSDIAVQNEGKMKDLAMDIEDMINDGASDAEIIAKHPSVSAADIKSMRKDTGDRPGEYDESLERMKAIAGIGSNAKSNHGIREGEAGYQITPRSIVAREMRKLQDLANK